jgi:hypothetical protein
MVAAKRWEGRRFSDEELRLAFQRILEGVSYVDTASELNSSLKFLYRQFGTQRERASAPAKRSPVAVVTRRARGDQPGLATGRVVSGPGGTPLAGDLHHQPRGERQRWSSAVPRLAG